MRLFSLLQLLSNNTDNHPGSKNGQDQYKNSFKYLIGCFIRYLNIHIESLVNWIMKTFHSDRKHKIAFQ